MNGAHYGVCVPSSCSIFDLRTILQEVSYDNQAFFTQVYYLPRNCYSEDKDAESSPEFTAADATYV